MEFMKNACSLRNTAEFSMHDLLPILKKRIKELYGEDYTVDTFIWNNPGEKYAKVVYAAFKERETYTKAKYYNRNHLYTYKKIDKEHEGLTTEEVKLKSIIDLNLGYDLEVLNDVNTMIIASEFVENNNILEILMFNRKEKKYLQNNFFCYDEELYGINDTIEEFAKQKVKALH